MSDHPQVTAEYVREWGRHAHGSPLYQGLVEVIAEDPELLRILNRIENQPRPNLLFAGVQYLLAEGDSPELAAFYPTMVEEPLPPDGAGPPFKRFVLVKEEELVEIGRTRLTQTNECRRCSALLPMVWHAPFHEFHLIDLGTSAGLNLALDLYSYRWEGVKWGDGEVVIDSGLRGRPPVPRDITVLSRTGLDLNPIDPSSEDERRWLDALIWPEQTERRERLRAALALVSELEFDVFAGDALETLEYALDRLPKGEPAVVMNSFVLIQFTPEQRDELEVIINPARQKRPIFRVSMEVIVKKDDWASLIVDDGSGPNQIGQAHPHGEWIELF